MTELRDPAQRGGITPLRRQYLRVKKQYPDAIVLFRLGDFYETFDQDAELAARELEITLTGREMGKGQRAPMAGIPHHALDSYLARLVRKGHKVAICEQLTDPSQGKGLVERDVVRVVTPGTVLEPALLEQKANNYLAAIVRGDGASPSPSPSSFAPLKDRPRGRGDLVGLAYADISTGEFAATELPVERVALELERLAPAEVLVAKDDGQPSAAWQFVPWLRPNVGAHGRAPLQGERGSDGPAVTELEASDVDPELARERLQEHFGVATLAGFGLEGMPLAARAAGALVTYLGRTQKAALAQLSGLATYTTERIVPLDPQTRRNLDLFQGGRSGTGRSLLSELDETETAMGARLLRAWLGQPLRDLPELLRRQDAVQWFVDRGLARERARTVLGRIGDVERLVGRVQAGVAQPRELVALRRSLEALPGLREALGGGVEAGAGPSSTVSPSPSPSPIKGEGGHPHPGPLPEGEGREPYPPSASSRQAMAPSPSDGEGEGPYPVGQGGGESGGRGDRAPTGVAGGGSASQGANPHPRPHPEGEGMGGGGDLVWLRDEVRPCEEVASLLARAIADEPGMPLGEGGVIREGFSPDLDELRAASRNATGYLAGLEQRERERTGIASLKVGYNRVFGYYLEVTKPHLAKAPPDFIRRQTLVNGERFITPELKEHEATVLGAQERMAELESVLFRQVCSQVAASAPRLLATARAVAQADVLACFAEAASRRGYCRPALSDGPAIRIKGGRHPVVERVLPQGTFVPNDLELGGDCALILLTGPNMGGKSTFLRQAALIVLMAQVGSFVPAEAAEVGLVDRIFTRVGLQDDLTTGLSTFMVEMVETAQILNNATPRSLVVLDEIGRGTSTYDGLAIARAVAEHLHSSPRLGCRTLFATHYHELTELASVLPRVRNFHVSALEEDGKVVFLHQVQPGGADRSYGVHVAQLAGLPRAVVNRARDVLQELEEGRSADLRRLGRSGDREGKRGKQSQGAAQLPLLPEAAPHPVVKALAELELDGMTPLEALNRLYEMQKKAKGE